MSVGPSFSGSPRRGGRRDRVLAAVVGVLLLAFLGIAVAKPWEGPSTSPIPSEALLALPAASTPSRPVTPSPSPDSPISPPAPLAAAHVGPLPVAFTMAPPPASSAAWTGLRWRRLGPDDPLALVTGITPWRHGFVATGAQWASPPTPVWTSAEGRSWQPLLFDTSTTFWPGTHILSVSQLAGTLVAVSETVDYCAQPCTQSFILPIVSWTSPDGRAWSPHLIPTGWLPSLFGIPPLSTSGPAGLVVASPGSGAHLATSADGTRWSLVPTDAFPSQLELEALVGTATGYVAAGTWPTANGQARAAVLWSRDGRHWPTTPTFLPSAARAAAGSTVSFVFAAAHGLITVGRDLEIPGSIMWWQSADGRSWRLLSGYPPIGPDKTCLGEGCGLGPAGMLLGDGLRMVAMRPVPGAAAWVSTDGGTWRQLSMSGDVPEGGPLTATLLPGGVLATDGTTSWYGQALTP